MHSSIQLIRNALGYAKFPDAAVHARTLKLLDTLGSDLNAAGYEHSPDVESAARDLSEAMNEYDREVEDLEAALSEAAASDDEDEEDE